MAKHQSEVKLWHCLQYMINTIDCKGTTTDTSLWGDPKQNASWLREVKYFCDTVYSDLLLNAHTQQHIHHFLKLTQ